MHLMKHLLPDASCLSDTEDKIRFFPFPVGDTLCCSASCFCAVTLSGPFHNSSQLLVSDGHLRRSECRHQGGSKHPHIRR